VQTDFLLAQHLPGGWGFDVALTSAALKARQLIRELPVKGVSHRGKPLGEYLAMADEIIETLLQCHGIVAWDHANCVRCSGEPGLARSQGGQLRVEPRIA
jgi:hypothetical protein